MSKLDDVIMLRKVAELLGFPISLHCAVKMVDALKGIPYDLCSYLYKQDNTKQKEDVMEKFWICYVTGTDGGRRYRHYTLESAQTEAERLAKLPDNQGKEIYLFECVGKCKVEPIPVKWNIPQLSQEVPF